MVFRKSLFNHFIKESKQKFYMTVQGVLALCEFHYCDFSKKSMNLPYVNFGQFYTEGFGSGKKSHSPKFAQGKFMEFFENSQ